MDEQATFLKSAANKLQFIIKRGQNLMGKIPAMVREAQADRHDQSWIEFNQIDERVLKRRYGPTLAADMIGVSHKAIYAAEEKGELPAPDYRQDTKNKQRSGYTINQINVMREYFGRSPRKPDDALASIIGFLNLKGGCTKTSNCHLFSQYLAIRGYRVLIVDTDPQGSLSFFYGKLADQNIHYEDTIAPFLLEDDTALVEVGHEPGASETLHYAIQKTYWDNIDIIPSCLQNLTIDMQLPELMAQSDLSPAEKTMRLREGLLSVADNYDFIVIDGTPSLNLSTLNVISACDMVYVPVPCSMPDYASTLQFTNLLDEALESYEEQNAFPNFPDLRFFVTKYTGSSASEFMNKVIRKTFEVEKGDVMKYMAHASEEMTKATNSTYSIYEINPSESDNRKKLKATVEMFDELYGEIHDACIEYCFGDSSRDPFVQKMDQIIENHMNVQAEAKEKAKA